MRKFYPLNLEQITKVLIPFSAFFKISKRTKQNTSAKDNVQAKGKLAVLFSKFSFIVMFSLFAFWAQGQNKVTAITVSATQTGAITYGTAASATYIVNLTTDGSNTDGSTVLTLNWTPPAGVIFSPASVTIPADSTSQNVTLTITSAANTQAGAYNFTVTSTDNYGAIASNPASSFVVNKRPLTITATGINKAYDGNTTATVALSDNRIAGDVFTATYSAVFADKNVGTGKTVTVNSISISGADAANYTFNTTATTTANITPASTTISVTSGNYTVCFGSSVTFTATITSIPSPVTGNVQFLDGVSVIGTVTAAGNTASFATPALTTGNHSITAKYLGDVNYSSSTSSGITQTISASPTAYAGSDIVSCNGATPITMTGATAGGAYSAVAWSGGTGLGTFTGSGTNPATYIFTPTVPIGSFIASLTVTGSGGCATNPSSTRRITWGSAGSWLGITSTDWNTASNWCGGIPALSTNVTIPVVGSVPFQPIIGSAGGLCKNITINGTLSVTGAYNLAIDGNWVNNGTFTPGTGTVTFRGATAQFISGSTANSFYKLTLNNPTGLSIYNNVAVSNNITFTNGKITTGANILSLTSALATVTGAGAGKYVYGNLQKVINGNTATTFDIGDASKYAPVTLTFTGSTNTAGSIMANTTNTDHPNIVTSFINPAKSVNRYWTLTNSGVSGFTNYAATFNFIAEDIDAGAATSLFTVENYTSSTWSIQTTGTKNTTNTTANSITNFGDFQIGQEIDPIPCPATGNTLGVSDVTLCIDNYPSVETTISTSMAANQYFTMNVIKGLTYQVYTNSAPVNPLTMSVYNDASPYTFVAFSFVNTANPKTSVANNVFISFTPLFSGKVRVLINKKFYCSATAPGSLTVITRVSGGSNTLDNQINAGTNTWIGHIYDGDNSGSAYTGAFTRYLGYYTEPELFDESFGGESTCFNVFSNGTIRAKVNTNQTFSVRYRMNSTTRKGLYTVDLGSDDGSRLAVDGALVYNSWFGHSWGNKAGNLISLNGNSSLVYDFYESGGGNRVNFNNLNLILANTLSENLSQTLCSGSTGVPVNGDTFGTLPSGISLSGTGYQWTYSTNLTGARTPIAGATGATYTPTATAPLDVVGAYYIFRNAVLSSINNTGVNPYTATNESSNYVTLTVTSNPLTITPNAGGSSTVCINANTAFTNTTAGGAWSIIPGTGTASVTAGVVTGLTPGGVTVAYTIISGSCSRSATSNLTVISGPTAYNVSGGGAYCASVTGLYISLSNTETGVNYRVYNNGTPVGGIVAGSTGISKNFPIPTTAGTYIIIGTNTTTGCSTTMTGNAVVTVYALPTGSLTVDKQISCAGDTLTFTALPDGFTNYVFKIGGATLYSGYLNTYNSATLPNGASISVEVTDANGCTATFGPIAITVNSKPNGALTASETSGVINDNIICAGSNVNFSFNNPQPPSNYQFLINGTTTIYNGDNAYCSTTSLADEDSVTVIVTNSSGCSSTFGPIKFTVNPFPVAAGALTGLAAVCQGANNITYTVPVISYATGYNWTLPAGATIVGAGNTNTITVNYSTTAVSGNVTVTGTNACGNGTSSNLSVTVNPLPVDAGTITGTGTVCQGQNSVTYTLPVISYATGYNWTLPAGATIVSGTNTNSITVNFSTTASSGNITVTGANTCGSGVISSAFLVTVNLLPVASGNITGAASVCIGTNNVSYSVPAIANATSYTWSYSGTGATISGATPSITINFSPTATSGSLTVMGTNGCGSGIVSAGYNITVNPLPTGTLTATENSGNGINDRAICIGANITFTATVANGAYYNFIINGTSVQNSVSNTLTTDTLTANTSVTVEVTNTNGCVATLNTINIIVNALPVVTLTGPNPICLGSTGNVYTTQSGQSNYIWNIVGGTIDAGGGSTDSTVTVSWTSSGTKTINVNYANANGCTAATSATFTNSPAVVPVIAGPSVVCLNSTGNVYSTDQPKTDYTWTVNGGAITSGGSSTDYTATVTWNTSGAKSISVNYSNVDGCNAATPTVYAVTVNTLPTASVTGAIAVCQSSTAPNITFTGTAGKKAYTFTYNINGSGTYTVSTSTSSNSATVSQTTGTPGVYTYNLISVSDANGCSQPASGTATVTVTATPSATISYSGTPFCTTAGSVNVTFSGTTGGTYASTPAGLSLNSTDGTITPSSSTGGTYAVTYTVAPFGGCAVFTITKSITITTLPTVTISYGGSPFCKSLATQSVSISGTGAYTGGAYTASPAGLTINSTNGTITPSSSTAGTYTVTYTSPATGGCGTVTSTASVTITEAPTASISYTGTPFCSTVTSAPVTLSGTGAYAEGAFSSTAGLSIIANSGTVNPSASTPGTYTVTYTIAASGGCAGVPVSTPITITAAPTVNAGDPVSTCASGGAVNIALGSVAANYSLITWASSGTGAWTNANSLTTATYTPSPTDITAGSVSLTLTATGNAGCASVASTKTLTINANPAPVVIKPADASFCVGTIQPLTSVKDAVNDFSATFSSGSINLAIPDADAAGVYKIIPVSGIPAGAVITSMSVNFYITHPYDPDLYINLKAPNGRVLNLANGLNGVNYTNTVISSAVTYPIQTFGTAPFTGTFSPQGQTGNPGASSVPSPYTQISATSFSDLYGVLNGDWYFSVRDGGSGDIGAIDSWSITINYDVPAIPVAVTWTPVTDLYTDAAATAPYTGESVATVYSKLATSGTKTYTATSSNAAGCMSSANVILTVKPTPSVSITADYCSTPGNVTLTANPSGASSYNWSTGETTQTVLVDIAHDYYVSATNSDGCVGTGLISVAQELVTNGDFTNGNTGFTSGYTYYPDVPGNNNELVNDAGTNGYAVGTNGQNYHPNFWGMDHTNNQTGNKNFMLVNGHGNLTIWEETVNVLLNTDYYFSAWAMSLNAVTPYAKLQFEVNGVKVGTIANLVAGPSSASQSTANNYWTRFYSNPKWNSGSISGPITIRIINNENAAGGNDFALDDISFATLSPFVTGPGIAGTDNQIVCAETPIQPISYKVGSGASGPLVTNLPRGVSYTFDGLTVVISGTPDTVGTFNYTVATTGSCPNPKAADGTIVVNPSATIKLTSSPAGVAQTVCIGSAIDPVTYSISGGGAGATVSGLPNGVFGTYNSGVFTISGLPAQSGTFNYVISTTGTCLQKTVSGILTVSAASVGGSVNSPTLCLGDNATLTLSGNVGTITRWEFSTDGGSAWSSIANTTNSFTYNITQPTTFRAVSKNNTCSEAFSTGGKTLINNLWEGKNNTDWSVAANWSSGNLPNMTYCSNTVTIPKGINFDPILTGTATITNLNIMANGHLIINGGNLQVAGAITNNGILDAANGGVEYNGPAAQTITAGTFLNNAIKDFKISNSNATGVSLGGPIDVYRSLTYGASGKNLNTNDTLTFKSTATETAWLGDMTGKTINGKATVERYISTGTSHPKSWQLLAVPTTGQTIKESWQEGSTIRNGNPNPGYGAMLTSNVPNAGNQPTPGFDQYTAPGPSIKVFNSSTNGYDGPSSTGNQIYNPKGYMILVRGDRTVITSSAPANPTVLRTKGSLITGNTTPIPVAAGKFESVGNPYASAIDLRIISRTGGVDNFFYVWDPKLGGSYGLGAFQNLSKTGNDYVATPGGGSYGSGANNYIQSGQAFFVQATGSNGTVHFTENAKASGSNAALLRPERPTGGKQSQLRANLYGVNANGSAFLSDGTLIQYHEDYANTIDGMDARKMANTSENLSIKSGGKNIVIERRQPIVESDTVFYNLSGVRVQPYRFEFIANSLEENGLEGFVEDTYLNTKTPLKLEGITTIDFRVTNVAGSYSSNRFRIVFKPMAGPLPVTFVSVKATQKNADIAVEWKVENESGMKQYEVEKSLDGSRFIKSATVAANNNGAGSYLWLDQSATPGWNYYRIRSIDGNGQTAFTQIVKVLIQRGTPAITIYPNPITNGVINLHLVNQPSGMYGIRLLNPLGQIIVSKQISHLEGNSTEQIHWDYNLAHGAYQLEVIKPDGGVKVIKVMY